VRRDGIRVRHHCESAGAKANGVHARVHIDQALFGVATASLLLLFIGIHNAWDAVTYLVFVRGQEQYKDPERRD